MENLTLDATTAAEILGELRALNGRLAGVESRLGHLEEAGRPYHELVAEMGPIGKEMMAAATETLGDYEKRGYFAFGREALGIADKVVSSYSAEDVRLLGENVVRILDVVRALTQPEVLAVAADAADVVQHPDRVEPVGMWGMLRAGSDEEVQRGMAMLFEILRHVGRGAAAAARATPARSRRAAAAAVAELPPPTCGVGDRSTKLGARLAPRRGRPAPASAVPSEAPAQAPTGGVAADGFLADPQAWTRAFAEQTAPTLGITLTADHWRVLEFARADWTQHGVSPNIRRIGQGTGLTTRELYALFPKAPGKTAARLAGIPKPAGCI